MLRILPRSLKGLLLLNETAFLVLVVATAALIGLWAHFWTQSSEEAVRINAMVVEAERIRGDMYRQLHEATRARLTENPGALRVYPDYQARIAESFAELAELAADTDERAAIEYLLDTYRVVHDDMDKVFADPNEISEAARMKLMDPAFEEWMLGDFESALLVFDGIVEVRRQRLDASRSAWTKRWTPVVVPVAVVLAIALLLLSRRSLEQGFVAPLRALVASTEAIARGDLEHRTVPRGVEELRALSSTFDDMTRKLADSQRTLVESERQAALGALVPVVAHNIRNPLASIRATAQVMDLDGDGAELRDARRAIIDTVDRLERWVTALLSYLHPLEPRRRACRGGAVLDGAIALLRQRIAERRISLVRADGDAPIDADADLLEQAVHALLSNAVEATPPGAELRVGCRRVGASTEIWIDDDGPGIDFEPDPQGLSPGPTTKPQGFGLGIPIAYRICHAHGGEAVVRRREGGGTSATITLPDAPRPGALEGA